METKIYKQIPPQAKLIRKTVFVEEQGFENEFDGLDGISTHLVVFDGDKPVATCRIYFDETEKRYTVGRIAVVYEYRGRKIGAKILSEAQALADASGGKSLYLHAQCRAAAFYEKQGYRQLGEQDFDEDCPHIWMCKKWD